ncbi:DUF2085 domain-containing protein [Defluviitalea phaphyphila]|uniref:DUF2085 domain-containing protein n=1 Tax=Defluviitalea phaphyphila TaxID=1473580 RepID=UPI00072FBE4B|nr:DUF2085 domain-containing protein [Defluviitalea phaphyphila]
MMKKLLYFLGRSVCHQIPERSFFIGGCQMPLCARCTGTYMGIFLGFIYLLVRKRLRGNKPPNLKILFLMIICWIPFMIDGATSYIGLRETNNIIRFITGLLFGIFIPVFIILIKNFDFKNKNYIYIIKSYRDLMYMILMLFFGVIIIIELDIIWWIISIITIFTILYLYIQIFNIIIRKFISKINRKTSYIIAFIITMIILSSLSMVNKIILQ